MNWTDSLGVTHAVSTYVNEHGTVSILTYQTDLRYASVGRGAWMRCKVRAPPHSKESLRRIDCMTCLVKAYA